MTRSTGRRKKASGSASSRRRYAGHGRRSSSRAGRAGGPSGRRPNRERESTKARGRNLKLAILSGVGLAGLVVVLLYVGPTAFFGFAFVVIMLAQAEFYRAARRAGHHPAAALGLVAGVLILLEVFNKDQSAAALVLFATLACSFLWYMGFESSHNLLLNVGITMFGIVYIPLLGSFVGLLVARAEGRGITAVTLAAVAVYDICAYAGGSMFGRRPMAPSISPNKTWEGAGMGTVGTVVTTVVLGPLLGPWNLGQAAILGALISVVSPIGDLVESMIKREFGIKDMGSIVPGHGGALDRIDAMLVAVPTSYLCLELFGL
jgi:phosphatidate cytidylyltransferase